MMPHHWRPLAHEQNSIFKCKHVQKKNAVNNVDMPYPRFDYISVAQWSAHYIIMYTNATYCCSYLAIHVHLFQNAVTGSNQSIPNGTLFDLTWTLPKENVVCDSTCDISLTVQTRSTNTVTLQCTGRYLLQSIFCVVSQHIWDKSF